MATSLPRLASPRAAETLEAVRTMTGGNFDIDAWHVINERDNKLIEDEILNGSASSAFVYQFEISGKPVVGISVVGARHLAAFYQGLKHRLVASTQKIGSLFTFTSFPGEGLPMSVSCNIVAELAEEPDYYAVVVELSDIKTGNTIQVECREARFEFRRDGSPYERPNYQKIAQSKGFRNGALHLIPQDVQMQFLALMLKQGKSSNITASVIGEKRSGVLRFAAQHAIPLDRRAIEHLSADQIGGLGDAARQGVPAFTNAARALGLELGQTQYDTETAPEPPPAPRPRGRPRRGTSAASDDLPPLAPPQPADEPPAPPAREVPRGLQFEV